MNTCKMSQPFSINFTSVFVPLADEPMAKISRKLLSPFLRCNKFFIGCVGSVVKYIFNL